LKIAIVGTGAMGSVYAGLLVAAGHEVWAIDTWREHVEAMRANGLRVEDGACCAGQRNCHRAGARQGAPARLHLAAYSRELTDDNNQGSRSSID